MDGTYEMVTVPKYVLDVLKKQNKALVGACEGVQ